jgi:hypothetical protein
MTARSSEQVRNAKSDRRASIAIGQTIGHVSTAAIRIALLRFLLGENCW